MQDKLEYLFDRTMVSETVSRYFLALDRKDWDGVRSLLTDPFTLSAEAVTGEEPEPMEINSFMDELVARNGGFVGTLHLNPNHIVDLDGDRARVAAYMHAYHWMEATAEDTFLGYGAYDIALVRAGSEWRLQSLDLEVWRADGDGNRLYEAAHERLVATSKSGAS